MPVTLEDLVDSTRRLADSNFATAAAINKLVPAFEQLRRDIYDIKNDREIDNNALAITVGKLNTDLALLLNNVKAAQEDVKTLSKDVTASHTLPPRDERTTAERVIEKFERMPTATKLWVFALILIISVGFGLHLILAAFGVGN